MLKFLSKLSDDESEALKEFATLGLPVDEFLSRMARVVHAKTLEVGNREINVAAMPGADVPVTRDDIRWVVQRYLSGKTSGEELSHWAGLLLAISAYSFQDSDDDDGVLALLTNLALPLKNDYLDRDVLKERIAKI
jgi:hypothetical protein